MIDFPKPSFERQKPIPMPGRDAGMDPRPDDVKTRDKGSGRLADRKAIITGGDSDIGKAVALAFAREGASMAVTGGEPMI